MEEISDQAREMIVTMESLVTDMPLRAEVSAIKSDRDNTVNEGI